MRAAVVWSKVRRRVDHMSIEHLSKAATAAGYAMVPDEEMVVEVAALSAPSEPREVTAWRVVESKLLPAPSAPSNVATATTWLRGALGGFGRGAPA
jgi:hypothetical protein